MESGRNLRRVRRNEVRRLRWHRSAGTMRSVSGVIAQLPAALKGALWQRFGSGFEQAYMGCLSWFSHSSAAR